MKVVLAAVALAFMAAACTDPDTPKNRETAAAMPDTDAAAAAASTGASPNLPAPDAGATGLAPVVPHASTAADGSTGAAGTDTSGNPGVSAPAQ